MLRADRRNFFGCETCRKDDLEHFDVIAVAELAVTDVRWLMDTCPGLEAYYALAFILELDPALEYVDKLELGFMKVGLARKLLARRGTDDMRVHASLRSGLDSEVTVLVEGT
jgi:hypothetical protein